jgi:hypothetical protein
MTFVLTDVLNVASESSRKRKVSDECRTFEVRWMNLYVLI